MSKKYWQKRTAENLKIADKLVDSHMKRLQKYYYETLAKVEKEIDALYIKMLKDDGISTTNLYKAGRWLQLKSYIENELQIAGQFQVTQAQKTLEATYEQILSKSYIDLNSSLRWGIAERNQMKQAIDSVWSGKHFSTRVWDNTSKLAYRVEQSIKDIIGMGKMPNAVKAEIMQDFNVGFYEADRLIRTETMYQYNQASTTAYKNAGVKQYQYLAQIDNRTSQKCKDLNNKVFDINSATVGVNLPPTHVMCRCTTIPLVDLK